MVPVSGYYSNHFWFLWYSFLVSTVILSGCYSTCFWLLWYTFLVATVLVSVTFWLLQYSFSGVMVLIFGCCSTDFCLLIYSFLIDTVHISGCFVIVLVSGCYGTCFYCNNQKRVLLEPEKSTVTTRNEYCNKATTINDSVTTKKNC
jgi:hypothetical protein